MNSSAMLSDDGVYRYSLNRSWDKARPVVIFVMLNPSTADAKVDDPTIRRCIGYAKRWGFGGLFVVNLYALRATDPRELAEHADPVGPLNEVFVRQATKRCDVVVAWGAHPMAVQRSKTIDLSRAKSVTCLGVTKSGAPRHPLYVRADREREPWSVERMAA